jgi:mono/diheme cytochrome c family protein
MRGRNIGVLLAAAAAIGLLLAGGCVTSEDAIAAQSESERVGWKGGGSDAPDPRTVAEGRRIAQSKCASCHSIDQSSVSPNAGAPAFRDFVFLNEPDWVAYRLIDGMRLGHDNMPLFDFDVGSADALMAYISTLND